MSLHLPRLFRHLARTVAFATAMLSAAGALAYITTSGAGTALASVATISAPSARSAQQRGTSVSVSWSASTLSTGDPVEGYRVTRSDGVSACGTPTLVHSLSCTDAHVPVGAYSYTVTAVYHSWDAAASTASVAVVAAPSITAEPPNPSVSAGASFSFSGGDAWNQCQLDGGTFQTCSSPRSYSGLADGQHTFKVHTTNGPTAGPDASYTWTVDSAAPRITAKPTNPSAGASASFSFSHTESAYTFKCQLDGGGFSACSSPRTYTGLSDGLHTFQVQAASADGATTTATSASWLIDTATPAGGTVSFTGGYLRTASVSVGFTAGADSSSGLNAGLAKLTRASAVLSGGSCGAFSSYAQIGPAAPSSPYLDTTVITGNCYRYQYVVSDNAGNQATYTTPTVAEIDTERPVHTLSASSPSGAYVSGTDVYYKGNRAGSFQLTDALADGASGPASVSFPAIATAGWIHNAETVVTPAHGPYSSSAFSWTAHPSMPTAYTITGADSAGNTATSTLRFTSDTSAPTGGALKVNGRQARRGGGRSSIALGPHFTIDTRTDYAESQSATQSGLQASILTVQSETLTGASCGAPGSGGRFTTAVAITGTTQPTGVEGGYCYLYTLAGSDRVSNAASVTVTVNVPIAISSPTLANGATTAGKATMNANSPPGGGGQTPTFGPSKLVVKRERSRS